MEQQLQQERIVIENDEDYQLFKTDHKDIQAAGELMKVRR